MGVNGEGAVSKPVEVAGEVALENVAYLYDGTLEGLLSAVFLAYERHEQPEDIVTEHSYEPRLGQSAIWCETDYERAKRVRLGVVREAGEHVFNAIMRASVTDNPRKGVAVYRLIRYIMDAHSGRNKHLNVLADLANPVVADVMAFNRHVLNEAENMRQFIRFSHLENGVWFARCNPNASVVPLVMGYFAERFNIQPFIIYDENHHIAGIYDGSDWSLVADDVVDIPSRTAQDAYMEQLWKTFYDAMAIDARYNPELRCHFMPVRLWKNLPEMKPSKQLEILA